METKSGSYPPGEVPQVSSAAHRWLREHPEILSEKSLSLSYSPISPEDIPELKLFQKELFPIRYTDSLYDNIGSSIYSLACYLTPPLADPLLVGIILFRIQVNESNSHLRWSYLLSSTYSTYIITIGVIELLRGRGIAKSLLNYCRDFSANHEKHPLYVSLHVAEYNDEAIPLYENYGFELVETLNSHYYINGEYYGAFYYILYLEDTKKPVLTWKNVSGIGGSALCLRNCFKKFKFFKDS